MTATQLRPAPAGPRPVTPNVPTTAGAVTPVGRLAASTALMVFTLCSAAGLLRVFNGNDWMAPVALTIVAVSAVSWALRAIRIPGAVAAPVVAVVGLLFLVWTVLGRYNYYGIPSATTWDHATSALSTLGQDISVMIVPVKPTTGFEILAVGLAGLAAALADWVAFRMGVPLAGLAPGIAVFVFCCAAGAPTHRPQVIGLEVGGACLYLLIERATTTGKLDWFAGIRPTINPGLIVGGGILAALAVVAALALSPALAPRDGAGVFGFRNGTGTSGGERIVPNPLVDLQTRLTQLGNQPVFVASSSVPSYWRLTSLDTFNGITWTSTGSYRGFGSKLPGTVPASSGTRTVQASFTIQQLDSPWLPSQFTPVSVKGGGKGVTYDAASNSLLTAAKTSNSLSYSVTSFQYLDTLTAGQLSAAPPVSADGAGSGDLALPSTLDPQVATLAVQVTQNAPTEYAKALAIQDFLRGPRFRYTLTPKTDGTGTQALTTFLYVTREGYCQQFAGAYAVLARAVGLPTRLAVGFVTGAETANGRYQVYDRDAHTWPEVYFGPKYGWVPFEPTPGFSIPGAGSYTQLAATGNGETSTTPATTATTTAPTAPAPSSDVTRRVTSQSTRLDQAGAPAPPSSGSSGGLLWLLLIPGAVAVWFAANGLIPRANRERRRRRAAAEGTAAAVAQEWDEVARDLIRFGLRRRPSETDDEYARRAERGLAKVAVVPSGSNWRYGGFAALAGLSRQATYSAHVPPDLAGAAATTAAEIRNRLYDSLTLREKIMMWAAPSPEALRSLGRRVRG